jgi:hypothetical protein
MDLVAMYRFAQRMIILSLMLLTSACQLSLTQQELSDQTLTIKVFDGGVEVKNYQAEVGSVLNKQVSDLILSKSKNWTPNFVTYAPGVVVYGKGFNINFLGEQAIYNGATGQLTRKIESSDYMFLISM